MSALTRDDVLAALGQVDDAVVLEILGTGASAEEFARARAWLANDEAPINAGDPMASGRVARIVELLADLDAGLEDERDL